MILSEKLQKLLLSFHADKLSRNNHFPYIILLIAHILLVWLLPYFPTQDGPSHIYNLVILHDLLNGGKEWGNFFTYQLHNVPNLGFNLIAYPLLHFFPPLNVEKIFISVYIILLGISCPIFLHTFGRPIFPLSFFVFPVVFNFTLLKGFYSYTIAIPLFLLAFSLAWKARNSSLSCKFITFNLSATVLFYFHLLPFIFYLLSLAVITVVESNSYKRTVHSLIVLLVTVSPVLVNLAFYLGKGSKSFLSDISYSLSFTDVNGLIVDLFLFSTVNFSPWQMLPGFMFMFLVIMFGYRPIKTLCQRWLKVRDITSAEKSLLCLACCLIFIYLFFHGLLFNQRFPWVIFLTLLPLLRPPETSFFGKSASTVVILTVTFFFIVNAGIMWQQNGKIKEFLNGLDAGLPKGAFIITYKNTGTEWSRIGVLEHAASYYGIFQGCVDIGNYETGLYHFPVRFKDTLPAMPDAKQIAYEPSTIDWSAYPSIQYLLGWKIRSEDKDKLSRFFHIIRKEGPLSIWQKKSN